MIALAIYLTVFFGAAIGLISYTHRDIMAEDKRYTAGIPDLTTAEAPARDETAPARAA